MISIWFELIWFICWVRILELIWFVRKRIKKTKNNPRELSYLNSSNIIQSTSRTRRNNTIIEVSAGQPDHVQPVHCNDLNCDHTIVYGHHMDPTLWTSFSSSINIHCQDGKCPFCKKKVKPQRGCSKTRQLIFHMLKECSKYFT